MPKLRVVGEKHLAHTALAETLKNAVPGLAHDLRLIVQGRLTQLSQGRPKKVTCRADPGKEKGRGRMRDAEPGLLANHGAPPPV